VFRVRDAVFAIGNYDPASDANVLFPGHRRRYRRRNRGRFADLQAAFQSDHGTVPRRAAVRGPCLYAEVRNGQIWVRAQPLLQRHAGRKPRLVRDRNGMAAVRAIEELRGLAPQGHDITLFGPNLMAAKSRLAFTPAVRREAYRGHRHSPAGVVRRAWDYPASRGSRDAYRSRASLRAIPRRRGGVLRSLLIATGSLPSGYPSPAAACRALSRFRDFAGCRHHAGRDPITAACGRDRGRAARAGGGERAAARGLDVTVVHIQPHLMEQHSMRRRRICFAVELERRGLKFRMGAETSRLWRGTNVSGVGLADGSVLRRSGGDGRRGAAQCRSLPGRRACRAISACWSTIRC